LGIPERQLLAAVHDVERVIDVERDLARRHRKRRTELVDQCRRHLHRFPAARHVLQPAHGRLRAQVGAALGTAADSQLQERVPSQPVEIVAVLVATADRQRARLDQLDKLMPDPPRVAAIGEAAGQTRADAKRALGLSQQKQAAVRGLAAALEIDCELLAVDSWKIEGKQSSFGHGGVALGVGTRSTRVATNCYAFPTTSATPLNNCL